MHKIAKEINQLLLNNETIKEYLLLKNLVETDNYLIDLYNQLDELRKQICKNKEMDSSEYYELLEKYNSDIRVKRYSSLKKEIMEYFLEISDILSLK